MPIEIRRKKLRYIQETLAIAAEQVGHAYSSDRENYLNAAAAASADALHEITKLLLSDARRTSAAKGRKAAGANDH